MCQASLGRLRHQTLKGYFILCKCFNGNYEEWRGSVPVEMLNDSDTVLLIGPAAKGFL